MRIPRIFTPQTLGADRAIVLEPDPSHHLARVLRFNVGASLILFNSKGGDYPAEIIAVGKKQVEVMLGNHRDTDHESPLNIHLGIALSRGERMDHVVQKSTELGVHTITPLFTERTEVKLKADRAEKKLQHWRQVAISTCEQCGRNRVPAINPPQQLGGWLTKTEAERKLVLHHRADGNDLSGDAPTSVALLIGPEGGLGEEEIAAAQTEGYDALQLGPRVLRTETAPLAAITILQVMWGDMILRDNSIPAKDGGG